MDLNLAEIQPPDWDFEAWLTENGQVFTAFREQDSSCVSYGWIWRGQRLFVKYSREGRGIASLRRAEKVYKTVQHPALPRLHAVLEMPAALALVLDWLPGENLYDYTKLRGVEARSNPSSPHARFRAQPSQHIQAALATIYDTHLELAAHGFIAVDFYDGCILYDFDQDSTHLCDLDEYRLGAFTLNAERLPGSRRFMAPEEWQRDAIIDQVTNVYTLGRAALIFLVSGGRTPVGWKGTPAQLHVAIRATADERNQRFPSVAAFVEAWQEAGSDPPISPTAGFKNPNLPG